MISNHNIYEYIFENIQKLVIPEELIKLELSLSRFEIVALVYTGQGQIITMSNLAQRMNIPMSTANGLVERLVKKGLVKRGRCDENRRVVTVSLTEQGNNLVTELKGHFHNLLQRVRDMLTEEEFETALKIGNKVIQGFQQGQETLAPNTGGQRRIIDIE